MECDSKDVHDDEVSEEESFELTAFGPNGVETMVVGAQWGRAHLPCWMIGVMPTDEDVPIPSWPMRFGLSERGYSAQLEVDAPDNTTVKVIGIDQDDASEE